MGVAGSGKTTLARQILRHLCAVYLDNNHVVDPFFPGTRAGKRYEQMRPGFYQALYTITAENLKLGNSVLLDMPHIKEVQTQQWVKFIQRLAHTCHASLVVIRCACFEKTLRARLIQRGEPRDKAKLNQWKEFLLVQPIRVPISVPHLEIDTEKSLSRSISAALKYIGANAAST
jgi:predicted kinase